MLSWSHGCGGSPNNEGCLQPPLSASLFHPRHEQIVAHNPLYAALVLPNMLKELVGWKTQ